MGIFDIFGGKKKNTVICKSSGQRKRESIEFLKELQIDIVKDCKSYDDFKAKVNMRSLEEILDT